MLKNILFLDSENVISKKRFQSNCLIMVIK